LSDETLGRGPFFPSDFMLLSPFRDGIFYFLGHSNRFSDERATQTGTRRFNLGTLGEGQEKLSSHRVWSLQDSLGREEPT
jgi:hypothetical protein